MATVGGGGNNSIRFERAAGSGGIRGAGVAAAKRVTSSLPDIIGVDGH